MKKLLILMAASETLTGLILLVYPAIVVRLLFNSETAGAGTSMSRLAGIVLVSFGVACWPDRDTRRPFFGMLTYSLLAMLYLVYVGVNGVSGILLWPGVAAHAVLAVLLIGLWRKGRIST